MTPLFTKLNLASNQVIHVLDAPESFEPELQALSNVRIERSVNGPVKFALAFVKKLAEVDKASSSLTAAAEPDATIWMVYPKGSSKKYKCEFNRDTGWESLGKAGYEPVRMVAIDADWSALRFRQVAFVKTMKRDVSRTISKEGRDRTGKP
ncbi:hypothetical protein GC170_18945 [bacterium]|nr:hypothetical protein [bacterium]